MEEKKKLSSPQRGMRKEEEDEAVKVLKEKVKAIKRKVIVLSGKGGVGKSTVAANLAIGLATKGYEVGLFDIDVHGPNIPNMLGMVGTRPIVYENQFIPPKIGKSLKVMSIGFFLENEDTAVIWRGPLKHQVLRQFLKDIEWGELDYLIVDSPPGTGDEVLSIVHLLEKVDGAIIVATPQKVALADVRKSITFCRQCSVPIIGIIENMSGFVCPKCGEVVQIFKTGGAEKLAHEYKIPFLGRIPLDPTICEAGDNGKPIVKHFPDSEPARAFFKIIDKIVQSLPVQ